MWPLDWSFSLSAWWFSFSVALYSTPFVHGPSWMLSTPERERERNRRDCQSGAWAEQQSPKMPTEVRVESEQEKIQSNKRKRRRSKKVKSWIWKTGKKSQQVYLLALLWNSRFRWVYLSFSPLPFTSLLFTAICKAPSDNHFAFLHFSWGWSWSLPPVQCHKPPSIVLQALCLSDLIPWIYLSLPLCNCKGYDLGHTWTA